MKPLTRTQTRCVLLALIAAFCFASNDDYNTLYVEPIIAQAYHDELNKPREALNRLQEVAHDQLALGEIK